jgi:hypothetical protein
VTPQATRHVFLAEPASNDGVVNWDSWRCLRETSRYGRRPAPAAQQKAAQATPLPAAGAEHSGKEPELDDLHATIGAVKLLVRRVRFGDLKLFEPKTMCPTISVRDRKERY